MHFRGIHKQPHPLDYLPEGCLSNKQQTKEIQKEGA